MTGNKGSDCIIKQLLYLFMQKIKNGEIEIYNEFSLQHELGIFLRRQLPQYKVQFERNTKFFGIEGLVKHEIDIVVYNDDKKYAIELKFPKNGQYPEQMYAFIKDICFAEGLQMKGFDITYCLTVVQDKNFFSGKKVDGIYSHFRDTKPIYGIIAKPTGEKEEFIKIFAEYEICWHVTTQDTRFYIIECKDVAYKNSVEERWENGGKEKLKQWRDEHGYAYRPKALPCEKVEMPAKVKVKFVSDQPTIYFEKDRIYEAYRPLDDKTGKWWAINIAEDDDPGDYAFPAEWFELASL